MLLQEHIARLVGIGAKVEVEVEASGEQGEGDEELGQHWGNEGENGSPALSNREASTSTARPLVRPRKVVVSSSSSSSEISDAVADSD
jgi:hypothetical protein